MSPGPGFFASIPSDTTMDTSEGRPLCILQIPSSEDLEQMIQMPAGDKEDQATRLTHMSEIIKKVSPFPIAITSLANLENTWLQLFDAIDHGEKQKAMNYTQTLAANDELFKLILSVHGIDYIKELISFSIEAKATGIYELNNDVVITPRTFEVLIKDLATTIQHSADFYCAFGLPSHHAYPDNSDGFCLLNKVAILIQYHNKYSLSKPIRHLILGTDVNRDDGLCNALLEQDKPFPVRHFDIYDSRVYPKQGFQVVTQEFETKGQALGEGIRCWEKGMLTYTAIDLKTCKRQQSQDCHPALIFAMQKLREQLQVAQENGEIVMIYLPMGWDSHQEETAACSKWIAGKFMSDKAAQQYRFNNEDMKFFYTELLTLKQEFPEQISHIYCGLEGGYSRPMYEHQIEQMLTIFAHHLQPKTTPSHSIKS